MPVLMIAHEIHITSMVTCLQCGQTDAYLIYVECIFFDRCRQSLYVGESLTCVICTKQNSNISEVSGHIHVLIWRPIFPLSSPFSSFLYPTSALQEDSAIISTIVAPPPLHTDVSITQAPPKATLYMADIFLPAIF